MQFRGRRFRGSIACDLRAMPIPTKARNRRDERSERTHEEAQSEEGKGKGGGTGSSRTGEMAEELDEPSKIQVLVKNSCTNSSMIC